MNWKRTPGLKHAAAMLGLGIAAVGARAQAPRVEFMPTLRVASGSSVTVNLADFVTGAPGKFVRAGGRTSTVRLDETRGFLNLSASPDHAGVDAVGVEFEKTSFTLILRSEMKPVHTFEYRTTATAATVCVTGSFNGWNGASDPLARDAKTGTWRLARAMEPGRVTYKFVVDGKWIPDPSNPNREPDGFQGFNSIVELGGAGAGTPPRLVRLAAGTTHDEGIPPEQIPRQAAFYEFAFERGSAGSPLDPRSLLMVVDNQPVRPSRPLLRADLDNGEGTTGTTERIAVALPQLDPGRHRVRLFARAADGTWADEAGFSVVSGAAGRAETDWSREVIYFAMTDRFLNGNRKNDAPVADAEVDPRANHQGGDWEGIRRKIRDGYFRRLGVTTLWISPVNRNADGAWRDAVPPNHKFTSYHGYWPVAARETNPRFGSPEELRALVLAAHRGGLKVIVDFVANHVHQDHPYFREHPGWFGPKTLPDGTLNLRKFDDHPLTTWFDTFLPDFDYDRNPDALKAMVDDAIWWAKEFNLDGFRHDATKHVSSLFWRSLTRAIRSDIEVPAGRRVFQVGESIVGRAKLMEYVGPGMLDGQFDFPLYWDLRQVMAGTGTGFGKLADSLKAGRRDYGPWALNPAFLGNHDFSRFMAEADGWVTSTENEKEIGWNNRVTVRDPKSYAKLRAAWTLLMTLPQVPLIYYGDEIGLTGVGDPDNRRMMKFGRQLSREERAVLRHVSSLTNLRRVHPTLADGDLTVLLADDQSLVILRSGFDERILVAVHKGDAARRAEVRLPAWCPAPRYIQTLSGDGRATATDTTVTVQMSPLSGGIYHLR